MKRICVFCGSTTGQDPGYLTLARELGTALAGAGIELVYGGAGVGLMGALADACLEAGGTVIGVIPHFMQSRELAHHGLSSLRVVDTMHERKAVMAELSSGFVALPGGLGTLEELFEVVTWAQLGLHDKPVCLLDPLGYYRPLLQLLDDAVAAGFVTPANRARFGVARSSAAAIDLVRTGPVPGPEGPLRARV